MKRFLSILLVAMLIVTSLATAAFAAGDANVSVSSENNAKPGEQYTLTFTVTGEFANYELIINDGDLKLVSVSGAIANTNTGKVVFATDENISSHSFTATFEVPANATKCTYPVNVQVLFVSDRNLVDQNVSVKAGAIKLAHDYEMTTKAATCTEAGEKVFTCKRCGDTYSETIPATGHNMVIVDKKAPTCTEDGYENQKCSVCGHPINKILPATGHTAGKWETTKPATCTANGEKVQKCTVCGEVLKTEVIKATGHDESGEWTITVQPTCTEAGQKVLKCVVCGEVLKTESIAANGHTACCPDWKCEHDHFDNKNHWFVCSVCGVTFQVEAHTMVPFDGGKECKCGYTVYDDAPEEPDTGDYRLEIFAACAAAVAMMAAAAYVYKRKFAK